LIVQSLARESLYHRRYESNSAEQDRDFLPFHLGYRDTLKELYAKILKFQATAVCYYSRSGGIRVSSDMIKMDSWDSLLADIRAQEMEFSKINDLWKDTKFEEECIALNERHQENVKNIVTLSTDVSGLRKVSRMKNGTGSEWHCLGGYRLLTLPQTITQRAIDMKPKPAIGLLRTTKTSKIGSTAQIRFSGYTEKV
jgi:N-terminal domain of NWD NACHT-NTPase